MLCACACVRARARKFCMLLVNKKLRIRDARQTENGFVHAHRVMEMLCGVVGGRGDGGCAGAHGRARALVVCK